MPLNRLNSFEPGLVQDRLAGLGYGSVTALLLNGALGLFAATPKNVAPVPEDPDMANMVKLENAIKIIFALSISLCVALCIYTTTTFTLITIYARTALGMGLQSEAAAFFENVQYYRKTGFHSFLGAIFTFKLGVVLSIILRYDMQDRLRWVVAAPALVVGLIGYHHTRNMMRLASSLLYSKTKED